MNKFTFLAALLISALLSPALSARAEDMKGMTMKPATSPADKAFAASMKTMMNGMNVKPTGKPDADFARMMIPHHQGAIDMAKVELQYGIDPNCANWRRHRRCAGKSAQMKAWLERTAVVSRRQAPAYSPPQRGKSRSSPPLGRARPAHSWLHV
jgi:uncharacterized protein (DUF305 family)